jgi:diaminopimelate epimerase
MVERILRTTRAEPSGVGIERSEMTDFTKVHGCGNDFVLIEDLDDEVELSGAFVRAICARHHGVGADGVIRLAPPQDQQSDVFMDYRNADGSVAEMCGNGVRCVAAYMLNRDLLEGDAVRVGSRVGVKIVDVTGRDHAGRVSETRVDMGAPRPTGNVVLRVPAWHAAIAPATEEVTATTLSMGNPHAVLLVDDVAKAPVLEWGPRIEHDVAFPEGTNVEFIEISSPTVVRGRIWERGVGETMASGTGASAMAVAAHLAGHAGRQVRVELPGGSLHVDWGDDTLWVRGPAVEVYTGSISDAWLERVSHD